MKDETARELVRAMAREELPAPSWNKVTLRADLEDQFATRKAPFARQRWVELTVYAGLGIAIAALALWAMIALFA